MNAWYGGLARPPLTPPDWIFGPVWTVLYAMIAVSVALYVRRTWPGRKGWAYGLIGFHLGCNLVWTYLFFGLESPGLALVDIVLIDLTGVSLAVLFWRAQRIASLLLWPYLAWVFFATYLNAGFFLLNRSS